MQEKQNDTQHNLLQESEALHLAYQLLLQDPEANGDGIIQICEAAKQISENASITEYSLAGKIAKSLHHFSNGLEGFSALNLGVIKAHIDALNTIFKDDVKGEGDAVGQELLKELESIVDSCKH